MTKKKRTARRARPGRPRRDRPVLPASYSVPKGDRGMTAWEGARAMLERARGYWLATIGAHGAPHVVQQWGAWVDDRWYFEGGAETAWARNLVREPRIVMSVERDTAVAIVEGRAARVRSVPPEIAVRIATQYRAKYGRIFGYRPTPDEWEERGGFMLRPEKILAWDVRRFPASMTRFRFAADKET